jgi:hypothetical protein
MIGNIITAGAEKQARLLRRLTDTELRTVADAMQAMIRVAAQDAEADPSSCTEPTRTPATDNAPA